MIVGQNCNGSLNTFKLLATVKVVLLCFCLETADELMHLVLGYFSSSFPLEIFLDLSDLA